MPHNHPHRSTQAVRIFDRFGSVTRLYHYMELVADLDPRLHSVVHKNSVYRWAWPAEKGGTGGLVPNRAMFTVLAAAKAARVELSDADLRP